MGWFSSAPCVKTSELGIRRKTRPVPGGSRPGHPRESLPGKMGTVGCPCGWLRNPFAEPKIPWGLPWFRRISTPGFPGCCRIPPIYKAPPPDQTQHTHILAPKKRTTPAPNTPPVLVCFGLEWVVSGSNLAPLKGFTGGRLGQHGCRLLRLPLRGFKGNNHNKNHRHFFLGGVPQNQTNPFGKTVYVMETCMSDHKITIPMVCDCLKSLSLPEGQSMSSNCSFPTGPNPKLRVSNVHFSSPFGSQEAS